MKAVLGIDAAWTAKTPSGVALAVETASGLNILAAKSSYERFEALAENRFTPEILPFGLVGGTRRTVNFAVKIAQQLFLNLAHRVARQFVYEKDKLGLFVFGEGPLEGDGDRRLVHSRILLAHHDGSHSLAEIWMRHPDDRAFDDAWQSVDRAPHLFRIDVEAPRDNEVLAAADDME